MTTERPMKKFRGSPTQENRFKYYQHACIMRPPLAGEPYYDFDTRTVFLAPADFMHPHSIMEEVKPKDTIVHDGFIYRLDGVE